MFEGNRTISVGHNPIRVAHTVSETFTFIMTCSDKLPCLPTCQAIIYTLCICIFVKWRLTCRPASSSAKQSPSTHWGKIRHKFQGPNFDQTRLQSYWLTKTCYECLVFQTLSHATRRRVWSTITFHFKKNCVFGIVPPRGKIHWPWETTSYRTERYLQLSSENDLINGETHRDRGSIPPPFKIE